MDTSITDGSNVGLVVESISNEYNNAPLYDIQSLCMRCHENGTTRILFTEIPHFRKMLLSAFECPHCGERNTEVQFAGELRFPGRCYKLQIYSGDVEILNRQVVKSESATIKIPELDFEIPQEAQRGTLSTVEGVLTRAIDELLALQDERKKVDPQKAEAIDQFVLKLKACAAGVSTFTFVLDDPAGNSFIENPFAPAQDPSLTITSYERTTEQLTSLGYSGSNEESETEGYDVESHQIDEQHVSVGATTNGLLRDHRRGFGIDEARFLYTPPDEVHTFPSTCGICVQSCETRMFLTEIPHFQKVIVMASTCDSCGYRSSELKPGGRIPESGKKITLSVENVNDLSRDVIKSDTASVQVPQLELELHSGTLGGCVTTVEGLMMKINESLESVHGFSFGDSLVISKRSKWEDFTLRLNKLLTVEESWTLIIDDAMANSFIAPANEDINLDHQLTFEQYKRSWEQDEELGLNDMDTSSADAAYDQLLQQ